MKIHKVIYSTSNYRKDIKIISEIITDIWDIYSEKKFKIKFFLDFFFVVFCPIILITLPHIEVYSDFTILNEIM